MPIYQIKIRGKEGIDRYDTFRQANAEDTINTALAEEGSIKKSWAIDLNQERLKKLSSSLR